MDFEPTSSRVSLVATHIRANIGFFSGMCKFMRLKMALCNELLLALAANEGSFTSVCPHMGLQVSCLRKFFQTLLKRAN